MSPPPSVPVVALIYTGGTIGMDGATLRPMTGKKFVKQMVSSGKFKRIGKKLFLVLHEAERKDSTHDRIEITFKSVRKPLDSSLATPVDWAKIASEVSVLEKEQTHCGIVVLHGTDTLAWTASALSFLLGELRVPVVMTGSQLPLAFSRTDALRNLISSIEFAASEKTPKEVCIFFDQVLLRGNRTTKASASGFESFESQNYEPFGVAGTNRVLREGIGELPRMKRTDLQAWRKRLTGVRVLVLRLHPGMKAFPQLPTKTSGLGIVLEAYGSGTADPDHGLKSFLKKAVEKHGAHIILRTQVPHGAVREGVYGAADWLRDLMVIPGSDITSEACCAKLYYLLARGLSPLLIKFAMRSSLRGEALLPAREFVDGYLRDVTASEVRLADSGQRRYSQEGEDHITELVERLRVAFPEGEVSAERVLNGARIDVVVAIQGKTIGFECSVASFDLSKAKGDLARLQRSRVDHMVLVGGGFNKDAEALATSLNAVYLNWSQALSDDWHTSLRARLGSTRSRTRPTIVSTSEG